MHSPSISGQRIESSWVIVCAVSTMTTSTQRTCAGDDRREAIQRPEDAKVSVLVPGVKLCPLVGAHCGARTCSRLC